MIKLYEACSCDAEFEVKCKTVEEAKKLRNEWRKNHKHEFPYRSTYPWRYNPYTYTWSTSGGQIYGSSTTNGVTLNQSESWADTAAKQRWKTPEGMIASTNLVRDGDEMVWEHTYVPDAKFGESEGTP